MKDTEEIIRYNLTITLYRIVSATGQLPHSFVLEGVECLTKFPILGGGFADIWRGRLKDGQLVALKVLRLYACSEEEKEKVHKVSGPLRNVYPLLLLLTDRFMQEFCKEVIIWTQFRHHHILPFLGVCSDLFDTRPAMVTPWMANGDSISYLKKNPTVDRLQLVSVCLVVNLPFC